jgi:hypothetical protein
MKFFKRSDILIVSVILAAGILLWAAYNHFVGNEKGRAEIYYESQLVKTVALDKGVDKTFSLPQNEHVIFHLYKDGSIRFEESDCPDKICIKTGRLRRVGESAACLPNKMIMKIVPENRTEDTPDLIIGQ